MDEVKPLEERIGGRWTGIVFQRDSAPKENLAKTPMRLCEAIKASITRPVVLTRHLVNCLGARRSLGWTTDEDDNIARKMVETTGIKPDIAWKVITNTPRLNGEISGAFDRRIVLAVALGSRLISGRVPTMNKRRNQI